MDRSEFEEKIDASGRRYVHWHGGDCSYSPMEDNARGQVPPRSFGIFRGKGGRYDVFFAGNDARPVVVCQCKSEGHAYQELLNRLNDCVPLTKAQVELHQRVGATVTASEHSSSQLGMAIFEMAIVAIAAVLSIQEGNVTDNNLLVIFVVVILVACFAYGIYLLLGWLNKRIELTQEGGAYRDNFGRRMKFTWEQVARVGQTTSASQGRHVSIFVGEKELKFYSGRTDGYSELVTWLERNDKL